MVVAVSVVVAVMVPCSRRGGPVMVVPWCWPGGGGPWRWSAVVVSWWWFRGGGLVVVVSWWWSRGGGPVVVVPWWWSVVVGPWWWSVAGVRAGGCVGGRGGGLVVVVSCRRAVVWDRRNLTSCCHRNVLGSIRMIYEFSFHPNSLQDVLRVGSWIESFS